MKVVVAHNRYQSRVPSGENRIVDSEIALLRAAGVEVVPYIEDSDELLRASPGVTSTALMGPWMSPRGIHRLKRILREEGPDVLHLHNVFPLVSPWAIRSARSLGVPVVMTVHNYRHTCVAGMHLRDGRVCEDCRSHALPWPAVVHGCYRGSRVQSLLMGAGQVAHRGTWQFVDRFLVASPHMKSRLESSGVDASRIMMRPTYAEDLGVSEIALGAGVAFVGRLDPAKGVELLLQAWTPEVAQRWGRLVVVGDGELANLVARRQQDDRTIDWRGSLDGAGVREVIREAAVVAIPSLWLEGFPRVAAEAMSEGRPVLSWEGAGFSWISADGAGWSLDSAPASWTHHLLSLPVADVRAAGARARAVYDRHCSPTVALEQLLHVYASVSIST